MTRNLCAILLSASILPVSAPAAASTDSTTDGALVRDGAVVNCGVGRRAVVRRAVVNGRAVDRVRCVRTVRASQVRGERRRYHRCDFPALAKHIADTIPGARLVIVPNAGHVLHFELPDVFNRELLKFLKTDSATDSGGRQ